MNQNSNKFKLVSSRFFYSNFHHRIIGNCTGIVNLREDRKKRNAQIDLKAEKLRVERAIELRNRQLSFRSMLNQQISDKIRLRKLQRELEEIEEQTRRKYLDDRERLIEEEKARLIEEYQKNEDGNTTKLPTDAYTLKIETVWTLDEEEIRKPYDLKDPL